jgi:uncharacterized SAM-binding protein YcdF (DUF218 family)
VIFKAIKYGIPAILIAGIFVYIFRVNILVGFGNYLIDVDEPQKVEAAFVLGGNSHDRGRKVAELFHDGYCDEIICLGGNVLGFYLSMKLNKTEAEMSEDFIVKEFNVPKRSVLALKEGTSTMEESDIILKYAIDHQLKKIIVVSSLFHTNRIRGVFGDKFHNNGITVLLVGTPSSFYNEENWWTNEAGLIMLNNEYVKTLYYWLKY